MRPLAAPSGTVTRSDVADSAVSVLAVTPSKSTAVTLPTFGPVSVTTVPTGPRGGLKLVIVGGRTTVKPALLVAVPAAVVTLTGALTAVAGTVAVSSVGPFTVKPALTAPKRTAVAPARAWPVMTTIVPGVPRPGARLVSEGMTVNGATLAVEPDAFATSIFPLVASGGTVARIDVDESTVTWLASRLPKRTPVTEPRLVPEIVTTVPTGPRTGAKVVMVGGRITRKSLALVAVPPGVVTVTRPVTALGGTVTVISVAVLSVISASAVPIRTDVAPASVLPLIVRGMPGMPCAGDTPVIAG